MSLSVHPSGFIEASVLRQFDEPTLLVLSQTMSGFAEAALAGYNISFTSTSQSSGSDDFAMVVELDVRLPVWTQYRRRPRPEQQEWARFVAALRFHEGGHVHITKRFVVGMYARMVAAPPKRRERCFEAEMARLSTLHDAYDRETGHGIRQNTPFGTTVIQLAPG